MPLAHARLLGNLIEHPATFLLLLDVSGFYVDDEESLPIRSITLELDKHNCSLRVVLFRESDEKQQVLSLKLMEFGLVSKPGACWVYDMFILPLVDLVIPDDLYSSIYSLFSGASFWALSLIETGKINIEQRFDCICSLYLNLYKAYRNYDLAEIGQAGALLDAMYIFFRNNNVRRIVVLLDDVLHGLTDCFMKNIKIFRNKILKKLIKFPILLAVVSLSTVNSLLFDFEDYVVCLQELESIYVMPREDFELLNRVANRLVDYGRVCPCKLGWEIDKHVKVDISHVSKFRLLQLGLPSSFVDFCRSFVGVVCFVRCTCDKT